MLPIDGVAIINSSDPNGARIAKETIATVLFFSRENSDTIHFSKSDSTISILIAIYSSVQKFYISYQYQQS